MDVVQKAQAVKRQESLSRPETPHDTGKTELYILHLPDCVLFLGVS